MREFLVVGGRFSTVKELFCPTSLPLSRATRDSIFSRSGKMEEAWRISKITLAGFDLKMYVNRMLDWSECSAVERDPQKVSGAWIFQGTRVPVAALFENLEDGAKVDEFIEWFPGVTRDQVEAVLEHACKSLTSA